MKGIRGAEETHDLLLLAGDLLCFLVFALLGLRSHEEGITSGGILRAAVPFQAGWLVVSLALRSTPQRLRPHDSRSVVRTWIPAWVLGLVLRTAFFDRTFAPIFAVVALLTNGVLLLAWRCLLSPLLLRRRK